MRVLVTLALVVAVGAVSYLFGLIRRMRDMIPHESAMTAVMVVAMSSSITIGAAIGVLFPEDLWPPTASATVAGVAAGLIMGWPAGLMVVLEGLMAGVMGGTMGAMMGGMMPLRAVPLIMSGAGLTVLTTWLTLRLLGQPGEGGHHGGHGGHMTGLSSASREAAGVALAAGLVLWFAVGPLVHRLPLGQEHQHFSPVVVTVTAREFGFTSDTVELPLGRPVRLRLVNEGKAEHDLNIPQLEYRLTARKDLRAEPLGLHLFAAAGDTSDIELIPLRAGEYEAYCSIPGHKEQGMRMVLKVAGAN